MNTLVLAVFGLVYLGMILGELPGLALDRTGLALLGAIVLVALGAVSPDAAWQAIVDVNLKAMWLATKFATPYLRESDGGAIVNCSSLSGLVAFPMGPAYSASKGGVLTLTQATALDLAEFGIRCNCYSPGIIDTPMSQKYMEMAPDRDAAERSLTRSHLVPRLGEPIEIARLVCFLASDDAAFVNGANYVIDGGSLAWRGTRD